MLRAFPTFKLDSSRHLFLKDPVFTRSRDFLVPYGTANYIIYFTIKISIPALEVNALNFHKQKDNT